MGPGLYLSDVSERLPRARLIGIDHGDDMLAHARSLTYAGGTPTFKSGDGATNLPIADGSVDLLTTAAVMHTLNDPFAFLEEIRRVLAPDGLFLLYDWVRVGFREYIDYREREPGDSMEDRYPRALDLFATHNKYTVDDWHWIFDKARFRIVEEAWPYPRAIALLARPR